jgi:hypothetical protein
MLLTEVTNPLAQYLTGRACSVSINCDC